MARQKLEINKAAFQQVVTQLEAEKEFGNPSELWAAVESTEWAKNLQPRPLTRQVAYIRAKELGIIYKTQPGKRGPRVMTEEQLARMREGRGQRRSRSEKMGAFAESFEQMRKSFPAQFLPLIERAAKGSLRAALTLKCLECSAYQRNEVRQCEVFDCPLFPHRPGSNKAADDISVDDITEGLDEAAEALKEEEVAA